MTSCIITELRPIDLSLAETKPDLIAVSPTVSIQTALNKMLNNKITSLPVFSHKNTEVVSIVNLFDILLYLVGDSSITIQKEKLKLEDPVEHVLGLDSDRESYRMHKMDRKDKLLEVSHHLFTCLCLFLLIHFNKDFTRFCFWKTQIACSEF